MVGVIEPSTSRTKRPTVTSRSEKPRGAARIAAPVEPVGIAPEASEDPGAVREVPVTLWQDQAMCKGKTEIFFARVGERDGRRRRREALARAYCACCPVIDPCREAGRAGREHGLWGSENDEERAAAGYGPRSPHRRAVAAAARKARADGLEVA